MKLSITKDEYTNQSPFPHMIQDNFLDYTFASDIQSEILSLPDNMWDRYENPFEQKYTLRDKYDFSPKLNELFEQLQSDEFISNLSNIVGVDLILDKTRNFWGVHKYKSGDKLDIHVDAGLHPVTKQKKHVTLGIYLSSNWKEEYGCQLELWDGENATELAPKLHNKVHSIAPIFNRMVAFTCNDVSWHGNPDPVFCPEDAHRIFITISYLSEAYDDSNKRVKAYFIARPDDPQDIEKDVLRELRADPIKYKDIYRIQSKPKVSIACLIYKSVRWLKFVYEQVLKYTDMTDKEFYFVANDACPEVLNYLKDNNIKHYIHTNTPEQRKEWYINNIYRACNTALRVGSGEYIVLLNSDMAFSPNWLNILMDKIDDNKVLCSRLIERADSGTYGIERNFGNTPADYKELQFLDFLPNILTNKLMPGGLYGPILIKKKHAEQVNYYPEGNIVPGSDAFNPKYAKVGEQCIPGDRVFIYKLKTIGVEHYTAFDSIVYHFQQGEMRDNS